MGAIEFTLHVSVPQLLLTAVIQMGLVFALEALPEELAFRGYIQTSLTQRLSGVGAIPFTAAILIIQRTRRAPATSSSAA